MDAKIIFLGTGGDSIVVGKQIRASGGIVVQVDDNQFHIDPGPGALVRAKELKINPRENTAVLVSHNHINHCNDVNAVVDAMTVRGLDKKGVLISNKTVYNGYDEYRPYLTKFHSNMLERSMALEAEQRVGINDIDIRALKAIHSDKNTVGFKLFTSEFTLAYTSDTKYDPTIVSGFKESDILIMNVKYPGDMKNDYHLCTEDAIKFVNDVKPKLVVMQHFGIKMLDADPINEARKIHKETKVQTLAANDAMVINPLSYSANLRTKTLNLYRSR